MSKKSDKISKIIIGGSGPSLAKIDYTRLPKDAQIWRINEFFKEPEYFLGRRVDGIFNGGDPKRIIDRYHTFHKLSESGAYDIDFGMIFADKLFSELPDLFKDQFGSIKELDELGNIGLWPIIKYNDLFFDRHPFSGVCAIIYAMLCGFDEIYIAGIDNDYGMGTTYAYSDKKTDANFLRWVKSYHEYDLQWELIKKYQEKSGAKIFCLSKESPAAKFFPLAPVITKSARKPEKKTSLCNELFPSPWYPDFLKKKNLGKYAEPAIKFLKPKQQEP